MTILITFGGTANSIICVIVPSLWIYGYSKLIILFMPE